MEDKKNLFRLLFKHTTETFAVSIIALTICGLIMGDNVPDVGMFLVGQTALEFQSIIQVFAWSCIMGVLITLFISDIFFTKIMLLWRYAVLFFLGTASVVAFAFVFEWIPRNLWSAWIVFLAGFGLFFGVSLLSAYAKTKREDEKLEQLLLDYKSSLKTEEAEDEV